MSCHEGCSKSYETLTLLIFPCTCFENMPPSHPLFPLKKRNNNKTMVFRTPNNKMHTYEHNVKFLNDIYDKY